MTDSRERLLVALPVIERRLELAGISTAVLEGGEGPPIVLLHGPGTFAANWMRVIPDLVRTHRVIAPDLPGHGASAGADGLDAERVFAWLDELIDRTCSAPPILCGNTLGGAIAARYASVRSERLARLILVDTLGLTGFDPEPAFGAALGDFLARPTEATSERLWTQCVFDLRAMTQDIGDAWQPFSAYYLERARTAEHQATQQGLAQHFLAPAIVPAELHGIAVPTTLIWGRHDRATPLSVAEAASARYGWPLEIIEDAADDPPLERPAAFLAALRATLRTTGEQTGWDAIARGYDAHVTPSHLWLGAESVARAGIAKGMRVLDVAAGSGALSIPAAQRGANVLAVDISPAMLARLRARAAAAGLTIETRRMDGHHLDLPDDTFDVAGSQFGVMLFPDVRRGLAEMVRVTRPGGTVLVVAFGSPAKIEFFNLLVRAMKAARPDFTGPTEPPLPFQLADPDVFRARLAEAGLREITIEPITEHLEFESGADFWNWLRGSNPIVTTITAPLSRHELTVVQEALEQAIRERRGGAGKAVLAHPMQIAIGRK